MLVCRPERFRRGRGLREIGAGALEARIRVGQTAFGACKGFAIRRELRSETPSASPAAAILALSFSSAASAVLTAACCFAKRPTTFPRSVRNEAVVASSCLHPLRPRGSNPS